MKALQDQATLPLEVSTFQYPAPRAMQTTTLQTSQFDMTEMITAIMPIFMIMMLMMIMKPMMEGFK